MSQPRRDWKQAREKCEREGGCRVCGVWPVEAAHVVGRAADKDTRPRKGGTWTVMPQRVVPLCAEHHRAYDAGSFDLLPHLEIGEQMWAVSDAGGIELARRRLCPSQYRERRAA